MAREDSRTIGGIEYQVACVDARTAIDLLQDMGAAIAGFSLSGASVPQQIGAAMRAGFRATEIADVLGVGTFAGGVLVAKSGEGGWPEHFRGRVSELTEWILYLLEVNYKNFTSDAKTLMARYAPDEDEKPSDAPS